MNMEETPDSAGVVLDDELTFDSIVMQRLVDEVRSGQPTMVGGKYDRVHNRHNR